ncbi:uncharacterized protein [Rutidosis leptorrhynchoides]|uniref:uncharacterized protein n=1 Tax=Rutidosis leptorrhynchoides TaxID=125765 RepID=UPI003A99B6B5
MSSSSSSNEEYLMQVLDLIDTGSIESENEAKISNTRRYIEREHEEIHGLPGMIGSIDFMHLAWEKCPVAWKCQFTRSDHKVSTIMLEVVASYDNCIWHAFFGIAGSIKNLKVLNASDFFNSMLNEEIKGIPFTANGVEYKRGYYLADGIYPGWA